MNKLFLKFISFFMSVLLMTSVATANENDYLLLKKGQRVPYDGILLSHEVAAILISRLEHQEEACDEIARFKVEEIIIESEYKLGVCNANYLESKIKYEELLIIKQQRIDFLEKNIKPVSWYETNTFYYTLGVITGATLYFFISK